MHMKTKVVRCLLLSVITFAIILMAGCGEKNNQNSKYTYGTVPENGISEVFQLQGEPSRYYIELPGNISNGKSDSYIVYASKTTSGGVVAYGYGLYVYCPNEDNDSGVVNALVSECVKQKN